MSSVLNKFFISSDLAYRGYEDAFPVVYSSYAMLVCLDPHCRFVAEITNDMHLGDVAELAEDHWAHVHALRSRDL